MKFPVKFPQNQEIIKGETKLYLYKQCKEWKNVSETVTIEIQKGKR